MADAGNLTIIGQGQVQVPEAVCVFDEDEVTQPEFVEDFADACRTASPYMEFLTQAVGLPY